MTEQHLSPRKRRILRALVGLDYCASNTELAAATGLDANHISRTLGTTNGGPGWELRQVYEAGSSRNYRWHLTITDRFLKF